MKGKKNRPQFKIGDVVVIIMYGTVGTITKLHQIDQHFIYEVNHGDILFFENGLQLYSEYEGKVLETERIDIEFQFNIGDIVNVEGYENDLFKVVGYRTEIWRYLEDGWEDLIYELTRMNDGEWLESSEDELSLVISNQAAESFIQQLSFIYLLVEEKKGIENFLSSPVGLETLEKKIETKKFKKEPTMIDDLLDIYNDYKVLYKMFRDPEYKEMMNLILQSLNRYETKDFDTN
ncbi:hypothetical protein ACFFIX_23490 [Metabacillus herbersteinensis]|uniref:DUF4176 domain-containing protein n=1 Tax=Metabacillus herbersteinensis TaxID=283816 RepID=A0ABV6GLC0_9BACI